MDAIVQIVNRILDLFEDLIKTLRLSTKRAVVLVILGFFAAASSKYFHLVSPYLGIDIQYETSNSVYELTVMALMTLVALFLLHKNRTVENKEENQENSKFLRQFTRNSPLIGGSIDSMLNKIEKKPVSKSKKKKPKTKRKKRKPKQRPPKRNK